MMRSWRRNRNEDGVVAVEFALILPVLVMLAFGIIAFGIGFNEKLVVTRAAREAARTMAITDSASAATSAAHTAAPSLDSSAMTVVLTACGPTPDLEDVATATISYPYDYDIPMVGSFSVTLSSQAVMHCGG